MNYNPSDFLGVIDDDVNDNDSVYDDMPDLIRSSHNTNTTEIERLLISQILNNNLCTKDNLDDNNSISSNDSIYDDMPELISDNGDNGDNCDNGDECVECAEYAEYADCADCSECDDNSSDDSYNHKELIYIHNGDIDDSDDSDDSDDNGDNGDNGDIDDNDDNDDNDDIDNSNTIGNHNVTSNYVAFIDTV